MIYSLTGFPFDLLWAIVIAFLFKPRINLLALTVLTILFLVPGYYIPMPFQVMYWTPGGAATIIVATSIICYSLTKEAWFKDKIVEELPERNKVRKKIFDIESNEKRQIEYIHLIQKISLTYEYNNKSILLPNTIFFLFSFFTLFFIDFSAIIAIHLNNPDLIKKLFEEAYQVLVVSPGTFDEWYTDLTQLGALNIFIFNMIFFLLLLGIIQQILTYRKIRLPVIGNLGFFQMPFYSVWIYIAAGLYFLISLQLWHDNINLFIAKNIFYIFSTLYIFQGISIFWLFLQVRLLPSAGIVIGMLLFAATFQILSIIILSFFILIGLMDFWFDFRKKALHPNLFSDEV
ncbi:MAG: YybS family protein [Spirochaetia bacterium]|nr:YybS family protein [Spirochaetia bacterium]